MQEYRAGERNAETIAAEYQTRKAVQDYRQGERGEYVTPAAPSQPKPWWQRAGEWVQQKILQPVQQAVPKVMNWVDQRQPETALVMGGGIGLAAAAIVLTGGLAAPIAIGLAVGAAGLVVGAGTLGLNAYFHRSLRTNLLKNTLYAAGAAAATSLVVIGGGLLVQSGVVQQGLYTAGNAATRLCVAYPTGCARVGAAIELWDKVEDWGLQAKLAIQTARGDPRAAETALELQLERLDNTPGNTTFREIQESLSTLVGKHGDEIAKLVRRFGNEGAELLAKYQDDAVEFFRKHADEAEDVSRYVHNVVDVDLANLSLKQGYEVSKLAQEFDVPITITGRWADTPAETTHRLQAVERMEELISQGMDSLEAQRLAAREFNIDPFQVKISGQSTERDLDIFTPKDQWDKLSQQQKSTIENWLLRTFGVDKVDFYQDIPLEKVPFGWPNPQVNLPRGAITFNSDGTIVHIPFVAGSGD